jgi:hypothetical protein
MGNSMLNSRSKRMTLGDLCFLWFVYAKALIDFAWSTLFVSLGGRNEKFEG